MWQAHGQVRAAHITGRYAVIATGVLGAGLFFYRQYLKDQKKNLDQYREEYIKTIKEQEETQHQLLYSLKAAEGKFKEADNRLRAFYAADSQLNSSYEFILTQIEENAAVEIENIRLKQKIE